MKRKNRIENMQKKQPQTATFSVPGIVNTQGNTIEFQLTNNARLLVYRNTTGGWMATFEGIKL